MTQTVVCLYLSTLTGGGRALDTSEPLFPEVGMMVSPSDLSLSTKLSTSLPLAPSFRALLGPLGLERKKTNSLSSRLQRSELQWLVSVIPGVIPDWSWCDLGLLRLDDGVCDDGPWGDTGHAGTAEAAKGWHLLSRALSVPPSLLQLLGLPPHLCLGLSFLSLWIHENNVVLNDVMVFQLLQTHAVLGNDLLPHVSDKEEKHVEINQRDATVWSHLSDSAENLLLVGVHLCEGADLSQVDVLSVAECHDLIEGKDQVKTVLRDFTLLQHTTVLWDLEWDGRKMNIKQSNQNLHLRLMLSFLSSLKDERKDNKLFYTPVSAQSFWSWIKTPWTLWGFCSSSQMDPSLISTILTAALEVSSSAC